jgi:protein SCO1
MVKGVTLRSLQVLVAAFAVAGIATLAVDGMSDSVALVSPLTPSAATFRDGATHADLPDVAIEAADGSRTSFAASGGRVRIATMFYSHCPGVCPMTIDTLRALDRQLTAEQQSKLSFVLLSLDPARDAPQALHSLAVERGIDSPRWLLGRTSEREARQFAAAAHLQYRPLSDGSIDHSSTLVLVGARGQLLSRASDAGDTTEFLATVRSALDRQ